MVCFKSMNHLYINHTPSGGAHPEVCGQCKLEFLGQILKLKNKKDMKLGGKGVEKDL